MLYLIAVLVGLAVTGAIMLVVQLVPAASEPIRRLRDMGEEGHLATQAKRRREDRSRKLQELLENLGTRVEGGRSDLPEVRQFLIHAGYTNPTAVPIYLGGRVLLGSIFAGIILTFIPLLGLPPLGALFGAIWGFLFGWTAPVFVVGGQIGRAHV